MLIIYSPILMNFVSEVFFVIYGPWELSLKFKFFKNCFTGASIYHKIDRFSPAPPAHNQELF